MTYPEAGPSRPAPSFRRDELGRSPWPRREDDRDREDGRSRLSEPSSSRPSPGGSWSRPPSRSYRPGTGARSNTPSPTRRYERDRDRDRFQADSRRGFGPPPGPGAGSASGPPGGGRDWENRRWGDRDRRDDRFRDYSPPRTNGPGRRPSPQPPSYAGRPHSPPRGPRALNGPPSGPANRATSGPRLNGNGPGPFPNRTVNGINSASLPRGPRSMRGSSSPVELRHTISDAAGPSSVPSKTVDLPDVKSETIDEMDLEEGEVISPVRRPIEPPGLSSARPGDRWAPQRRRGSLSPRKHQFRSRPPSPDRRDWDRDRDRQRDWRDYRRSLSPVMARPKLERQDSGRHTDPSPPIKRQTNGGSPDKPPPRASSPPRPSTPPIPSPVEPVAPTQPTRNPLDLSAPPRPDTPLLPEPPHHGPESKASEYPVEDDRRNDGTPFSRPHTPELPVPALQTDRTDSPEQASSIMQQTPTADISAKAVSANSTAGEPATVEPIFATPSVLSASENAEASAKPLVRADSPILDPPQSHDVEPTSPSDTALTPALDESSGSPRVEVVQDRTSSGNKMDVDVPVEELLVKLADTGDSSSAEKQESAIHQLISPPTSRATIAERRSVKLPDSAVPLSSPFNDRIRKDSMPTAGSGHTSTDAETEDGGPRTAEIRDDLPSADLSDGAVEELRKTNVALAVKRFSKGVQPDRVIDSVYAWNVQVAPAASSRIPKHRDDFDPDRRLRQITWPLNTTQRSVAKLVSVKIQRERRNIDTKLQDLRAQYKLLHEEWELHCKSLDQQMEKRGPPPTDLYDIPNAFKPLPMPGPGVGSVLPSPSIEEPSAIGRANRRRGGGDFVATDADLEEIMANLKQIDDQDPTFRARKTTATVPDMLLGAEGLSCYDDDNDLVDDPLSFYDFAGKLEPIWTPEEKEVFRRVYPNCGKQFGKVADKLPNKSVGDCVQYYYRTKKEIDWKGLVAAKRGGERKRNRAGAGASVAAGGKKPGKSSALLADLERQKPTVNPNTSGPGGKSTITPGRPGKGSGPRQRDTPSETGGGKKRKTTLLDNVTEGLSSEATSRAGSEAPASKAKMRMSIKGKRPRVSSVTGLNALAASAEPMSTEGIAIEPNTLASTPTPTRMSVMPIDPQAELLPPPKRPGKRRKMVAIDPNTPDTPSAGATGVDLATGTATATPTGTAGEKSESKPRRSNTNSYWSVDEKKLVRSLHLQLGDDMEQIASHIPGKSVRQVTNWLASRGLAGDASVDTDRTGDLTNASARAASFDIYGNDHSDRKLPLQQQQQQQPRLGTFPDPGAGSGLGRSASPTKPFSRPGGMQISALLNNDESAASAHLGKPSLDALDAASDGTVEDEGMARPPSRHQPPVRQEYDPTNRPPAPPDLDRYKTRFESAFQTRPPPNSGYYASSHGSAPVPPPSARSWDHAQSHAPSYHYSHHHSQPPQMGVFGPGPPSSALASGPGGPQYSGRTVYSAKLEQERGLPPPRNRGRSDGPAFSGFPPPPTQG